MGGKVGKTSLLKATKKPALIGGLYCWAKSLS